MSFQNSCELEADVAAGMPLCSSPIGWYFLLLALVLLTIGWYFLLAARRKAARKGSRAQGFDRGHC
jgi:hypothetical protein